MADEAEEAKAEEAEEQAVAENAAEDGDAAGGEEEAKGGLKEKLTGLLAGRNMLMIAGVPAALVILGGGYFAVSSLGLFSGGGDTPAAPKELVYYDLPEMVVNLSSTEKRAQFLKLKVSLEAENSHALAALEPVMPRVLDMFQLYLRELRSKDLDGSAGIFRLKEELLRRINLEVHPHKITRVLFKEIIVQ